MTIRQLFTPTTVRSRHVSAPGDLVKSVLPINLWGIYLSKEQKENKGHTRTIMMTLGWTLQRTSVRKFTAMQVLHDILPKGKLEKNNEWKDRSVTSTHLQDDTCLNTRKKTVNKMPKNKCSDRGIILSKNKDFVRWIRWAD